MAEIGLISSIITVVVTGAKVSINLYRFADAVGSAGDEVRNVATEISLFCAVLKQLDSTLKRAKTVRYSLTALDAAMQIIDECRRVFDGIEKVMNKLKRESASSSAPVVNFSARVKWIFKRSEVLLYRRTLESMKGTLHLMLATLAIAENIAAQSDPKPEAETEPDDEGNQLVAQSLMLAQQVAVDNLRAAEEENEDGEDIDPGLSQAEAAIWKSHDLNSSFDKPSLEDPDRINIRARPSSRGSINSAWFSNTVFDDGLTPEARRESWASDNASSLADSQLRQLCNSWVTSAEADQFSLMSSDPSPVFKDFHISIEDPCYKLLPAALRTHNINADWQQYALSIEYGNEEQCLGLEEKPMRLFQQLKREGKSPTFILRKILNTDISAHGRFRVGGIVAAESDRTNGVGLSDTQLRAGTAHDMGVTLPGGLI